MRAKYEVQKPMRNRVVPMILICLVLAFSIMGFLTQPVLALPAGFQEFYLPLPTGGTTALSGTYSVFNAMNPTAVDGGMHYLVGVTASQDNTVVYYDHWEVGGLGTGTNHDIAPVYLNKGQVAVFESGNIPVPRGTGTYYDGGDRIFVSGGLLQLVVSTWTEQEETVFTDAWEVYPVQAWQNSYVIPVGDNLADAPRDYNDFTFVYALVMSGSDSNAITVTDRNGTPVPGLGTTLNRGQTYIFQVTGDEGYAVTGTGKIQVQLMTGTSGDWEMRGYTLTPRPYWGNAYFTPVSSGISGRDSELYLYNPNGSAINVTLEDAGGAYNYSIPARSTRSYSEMTTHPIPQNSGAYVHTQGGEVFWGIGAGDTESTTWDWGYALIPVSFLGTDNYVSWAPCSLNLASPVNVGSPVYLTALYDDTTVYVDYGPNNGTFDVTYTDVDRFEVIKIYDPDKDNTGMHIVSTNKVAVAWGEDPNTAPQGTPGLDMGYTTLPLPIEWIDVALEVEKTADPTTIPVGGQSTFTVQVRVPSTAGAPVIVATLKDQLPPHWDFVSSSLGVPSTIGGSLSTGWLLTWTLSTPWTINPGNSQSFTVVGRATGGADVSAPNRNAVAATGTSVGANLTADDDAFVTVSPSADLSLTKAVDDPTPNVGSNVTFTIVVSNGGPSDATGVNVTDVLPYGLTFVSADPAASYNNSTGVWTVGNLTNGANATLTIVATVSDLGGSGVTNIATASAITVDPALGNNAASAGVGSTSSTVGYNVLAVNKVAVMAPWIALFAVIAAGVSLLVLRRRRTQS